VDDASFVPFSVLIDSHMGVFTMDNSEKSLQDPTVTHELFQLISKMSDDERRTLLKILKEGLLKDKC
jgi:hypothetical protein